MCVSRRDFLRKAAQTGATTCAGVAGTVVGVGGVSDAAALERAPKPLPPEAVGLLYDGTLCIGCKACVKSCKEANGMPPDVGPEQQAWNQGEWDTPVDLSGKTLNIIKVYAHGTMETKDAEKNGYAFSKRQCLHCVDPSCVSVCPVSAMRKDPVTGIVSHNKDACIGCRYCVYACPFGVPRYDFSNAFGAIAKCQLCRHRLAQGQLPACADVCPTGATLFGRRDALMEEAKRRLALKPGDTSVYPRGSADGNRPAHEKRVEAALVPHVYGEKELGGTQCLAVSAVPFEALNFPTNVPETGYPTVSEGIQHTVYQGLAAPAALLAGLVLIARRNHMEKVED